MPGPPPFSRPRAIEECHPMKTFVWQGKPAETDVATVAAFLEAQGVVAARCVVEWKGEAYAPGDDLSTLPREDGAELAVFKVVAGG